MQRIVLASSSKYRQEQLQSLGVSFEAIASHVDEDLIHEKLHGDWESCSLELAKEKAKSVFEKHPDAKLVIGADQIASCDGKRLGKSGSKEAAKEALRSMSGKRVYLYTATCLVDSKGEQCFVEVSELHMRQLSKEEIDAYVEFANPIDCAGSFKIELGGIALFESLHCKDFSSILGLPLLRLAEELRVRGVELFQS